MGSGCGPSAARPAPPELSAAVRLTATQQGSCRQAAPTPAAPTTSGEGRGSTGMTGAPGASPNTSSVGIRYSLSPLKPTTSSKSSPNAAPSKTRTASSAAASLARAWKPTTPPPSTASRHPCATCPRWRTSRCGPRCPRRRSSPRRGARRGRAFARALHAQADCLAKPAPPVPQEDIFSRPRGARSGGADRGGIELHRAPR